MLFGGHRRNPIGYGQEIERFDVKLGQLLPVLREDDLLIITADHGNDPTLYRDGSYQRKGAVSCVFQETQRQRTFTGRRYLCGDRRDDRRQFFPLQCQSIRSGTQFLTVCDNTLKSAP